MNSSTRISIKTLINSHGEVKLNFITHDEKKGASIGKEDLVHVAARRMNGKEIKSLSVEHIKRRAFFSTMPAVEDFLRREPCNPNTEEGDIKSVPRERKGEYYILPEMLALLIDHDKRKYAEREEKLCSTDNVIVIDNNPEKLCEFLFQLILQENEAVEFTVVDQRHIIASYLRNEKGKLKCYIGDSAGITLNMAGIARAVESCFEDVEIIVGPDLQKDYNSCSTFARETNRFYIKHGSKLFLHIDKVGTQIDPATGFRKLAIENTMAVLLKLSQTKTSFPDEVLDAVVSVKKTKTLRHYFAGNELKIDGSVFNTAALLKRYRCFTDTANILHKLGVHIVSSDQSIPLPAEIVNVLKHCYIPPGYTNYVQICSEVADFLFPQNEGNKDKLSTLAKALLNYLRKKIPNCKEWYHEHIVAQHFHTSASILKLRQIILLGLAAHYKKRNKDEIISDANSKMDRLLGIFPDADIALEKLSKEKIVAPEDIDDITNKWIAEVSVKPKII